MTALRYGYERRTWAGCYRDEIPSRERYFHKPEPFVGMCKIILPGFHMDLALHQNLRDMRRFRAVDLDGRVIGYAAPRELFRRTLADLLPIYSGAQD